MAFSTQIKTYQNKKSDVTESVRCEWVALTAENRTASTPTKKKTTTEKQQRSCRLTKLVADALVVQQRRVLEGVPAVQDAGVGAHCCDAAQRQHGVVDQK